MFNENKTQSLIQLLSIIGVILFINILCSYFYTFFDLTEEKRFTLTTPTKKALTEVKDIINVKVLLTGDFPSGFKRLQTSTTDMLRQFHNANSNIIYSYEDPNVGTIEEINDRRKILADDGIKPVNFRYKSNEQTTEKQIYPVAILQMGTRKEVVNLLESQVAGIPDEEVLNNSVSLIEYKLANAIVKLITPFKPRIVLSAGKGELDKDESADLVRQLEPSFELRRMNLDTMYRLYDKADLLIMARPRGEFSEKNKFVIDQFVMHGGKVLFLIDKLNVAIDSLQKTGSYVPGEYQMNLDDLLFKYGARIQPNLVLDMECSKIPLVTGQVGGSNQYDMFPWPYDPLATPKSDHPIVKNLDRVNLMEPSSIDTIQTKTNVQKTVLLSTSDHSRLQYIPTRLNFEILRYDFDPSKFDKKNIPMAVLLEGVFPSLYENRVSNEMNQALDQIGTKFVSQSKPTKIIVVADGDIARNYYNPITKEGLPLGFNRLEKKYYPGNKNFLINAIEYLLDQKGILQARTKEVKLRLLDKVKAEDEKLKWQLINVLSPLLLLAISGFIFIRRRNRKYGLSVK